MGEEVLADIVDDLLADMGHNPGADGAEQDADEDDPHIGEGEPQEQGHIFARDRVVQHPLHDLGLEQGHHAGHRAEQQGEAHFPFVAADVLHGALQVLEAEGGFQGFIHFKCIASGHQHAPPFTPASSGAGSWMSFCRA